MSSGERGRRSIAVILIALLGIAALRDLARLGEASPWRTMDDFPDFYCAGSALDENRSPYRYEPLHACEHRANALDTFRGRLFQSNPAIAVPAPLPAYDFLPFMALARAPIATARVIDAAAILASVLLAALALSGLGIPLAVAVGALLLSTGYVELNTGQVVPFALLALVLAGLALARRKDALAGVLAVVTAVEPVVGLPVALATLLYVPRARRAVVLSAVVLAALALAVVGPQTLLEYVTRVIPAQAASELHFPFQYSLTYASAHLGLPPGAAGAAGTISSLILLAVALWLAPRAARALGRRELLVFVPALCCVIGGPYLHQEELCLALPALLVFAVYAREPARTVFAIALCMLAIPWIAVWGIKQLFLASIFCVALILWGLRVARWPAIATLAFVVLAMYSLELHPPHLPVPVGSPQLAFAQTALVQDEWRVYAEQRSTSDPLWFAIKFPTWGALLAALGLAIAACRRPTYSTSRRI